MQSIVRLQDNGFRCTPSGNVRPLVTWTARAAGVALLLGLASSAWALEPRLLVPKPAKTAIRPHAERTDVIYVKFQDDSGIRLRAGTLTDPGGRSPADLATIGQRFGGGHWERVHAIPEQDLDGIRARAEQNLGKAIADLNVEYHYHLPAGADAGQVIDAFNALNIVEIALPVPLPVAAPVPPNYQPNQGYLNSATAGVDTACLWQLPGGTGVNVALADLEYSWNLNHQDLNTPTLVGGTPTDPFNDTNHGTAVLGELAGLANGWGVTGIAYGGTFYVAAVNVGGVQNISTAITAAVNAMGAGDVILIEQQIQGPNYTGNPPGTQVGLVPVEWYQPYYNSIVAAVGNGFIVVEAAGNGSQNLDDPVYNSGHAPFLLVNDSGALIVGAGAAPGGSTTDRSRLSFSNYGSTVDLQGWGELVYTTGYGNLYASEGVNLWYTGTFSGTSSASPIVAGAAMLLQSAYNAATGAILSPAQVKTYLQFTASPQQSGINPASQSIGGRPNASAALAVGLPAIDSNSNQVPDWCEQLAGIEACCLGATGCVDTTPANCAANGGTAQGSGSSCAAGACSGQPQTVACCRLDIPGFPCTDIPENLCIPNGPCSPGVGISQGPGSSCATASCPAIEACCYPDCPAGPLCLDEDPLTCIANGGIPRGPGSFCGAGPTCTQFETKFEQPPTFDREDIASNIDLANMTPNVVVADDFQSDGRPITAVRWWGSYLDPRYQPVQYGGLPSPFEVDGWLISFHEPLDACPNGPGGGLLALYFAPASDVIISPTTIPSCDGHPVYQYTVELFRCCLLHKFPDTRSGLTPAEPFGMFHEEHCFDYHLDIQAVTGRDWDLDLATGMCVPAPSPNGGTLQNFWGWHATHNENGYGQQVAKTTSISLPPGGLWVYGPWTDALPVCGPFPVNMAFALYTNDPILPPICTEACCDPVTGGCLNANADDCRDVGFEPQGPNTNCDNTPCVDLVNCCDPLGGCLLALETDCQRIGGTIAAGGVCLGDMNSNGIDDACEADLTPYVIEFSLDIGSDTELSDPNQSGNEAFDPGDVYASPSAPVVPPGRDGFKDDELIFGCDPAPEAPHAGGVLPLPGGTIADYAFFFDLDGHDQLDIDLLEGGFLTPEKPLPAPIPFLPSVCIYPPEHLLISFDDDHPAGWPVADVPTVLPALSGSPGYGSTQKSDEIVGLRIAPGPFLPPLAVQTVYTAASELRVHPSLAANPDGLLHLDDDVDSLDIVPAPDLCPYWYFTADHEAHLGLDPGSIYQVTPAGPVKIIDDVIHLGIPEEADVDAFEFVWMEDPALPGLPSLGVLFSTDLDDPLTPGDESGGIDPFTLSVSFLGGVSYPALPPILDDIDAVTVWHSALQSCPGDCLLDGVVDDQDQVGFTACMSGPAGGLLDLYCSCADYDVDLDVDLLDFAAFQRSSNSSCP